jgi:hypothetical protein
VNSLLKEGLCEGQLITMKKNYLRPGNCPTLETPKANTMLWSQLKQKPKNVDMNLQKGQGCLFNLLPVSLCFAQDMQRAGREIGD